MSREQLTRGYRNVWILSVFLSISCATANRTPYPSEDRVLCVVNEFKDFTGDYEKVDPSFERLLQLKLTDDYTLKFEPSVTSGGRQTTFVANQFLNVNDSQSSRTTIFIEGDVEQIQYGRPQDVLAHIPANRGWRSMQSIIRDALVEDVRAALVEYRVRVFDSDKKEIDVILVQGIFKADFKKMSRQEIVHNANKMAAEQLAWELNTTIAKKIGLERRSHSLPGEQTEAYPSALWDEASE